MSANFDGNTEQDAAYDVEIAFKQGTDFKQLKEDCDRNPGHEKFIEASKFEMNHLPEGYQDEHLYQFLQTLKVQAVRLCVNHTSEGRPKTFPRSQRAYPASDLIGQDCIRTGSGWVRNIHLYNKKSQEPCPCAECQASGNPVDQWGRIEVATANHLVFDSTEAKHTEVDLFYDEEAENPGTSGRTKLTGYKVWYNNIVEDKCWMFCATHDLDLCQRLLDIGEKRKELFLKVNETFEADSEARLTAVISHPHGCCKTVCIGEWAATELTEDSPWWGKATYSSIVCSGSSGAPVWSLGRKDVYAWRLRV